MFTHQTILSLQTKLAGSVAPAPVWGHFRDYHFARSVMEAKQHLLRCLQNINPVLFPTPDFILVDAGAQSGDIKFELEQWMERHPRLRRVRVVFPAKLSWIRRRWNQWARRDEERDEK